MVGKFWMVYVDGGNAPCHQHETKKSAIEEAKRLLLLSGNQAKTIYVLEAIESCCYEIKWETSTLGISSSRPTIT